MYSLFSFIYLIQQKVHSNIFNLKATFIFKKLQLFKLHYKFQQV